MTQAASPGWLINSSPMLQLTADLANGSKHFTLTSTRTEIIPTCDSGHSTRSETPVGRSWQQNSNQDDDASP
jgi:hypothetical protein